MQQLFERLSLPFFSQKKASITSLPSFLYRISTLLHEGYTLMDSIKMILPYHVRDTEYWNSLVNEKVRNGTKVAGLFETFSIPKSYLLMIKIAEETGTLPMTLHQIAKQMEQNEKMLKKLRTLLLYPIFLLCFLIGIFIAFRIYFFPNIEQVIYSRSNNENISLTISKFFLHLPDYILLLLMVVVLSLFLFLSIYKRKSVEKQIKISLKVPLLNYFYRMNITRLFSKLLGGLLLGGFSLQNALIILKEYQDHLHLAHITEKLEQRIIYGDSLSAAVSMMNIFYKRFEDFIYHGEQSGYLGRELLLYCELLENTIQSIMKIVVSIIQPMFFIIIAVCIIAAYLSILLPIYNLIEIV